MTGCQYALSLQSLFHGSWSFRWSLWLTVATTASTTDSALSLINPRNCPVWRKQDFVRSYFERQEGKLRRLHTSILDGEGAWASRDARRGQWHYTTQRNADTLWRTAKQLQSTLTSEEKAPGAVPNRMLAVAETMIESFMLILELC